MIFEKLLFKSKKICAVTLAILLLAIQIPIGFAVTSLAAGTDTLGDSSISVTSSHSIAFTTQTNLDSGDKIELYFPDFTFIPGLDSISNVTVGTGPTSASATYDNDAKTITLTLTESFTAGGVVVTVVDEKIINPSTEGEYSVSILTLDASNSLDVLDSGIAKASVDNEIQITINVAPVNTNVTSSKDNGSYWIGSFIPIQVTFSGEVLVTGTPQIALNSGGTAYYSSGSGTSTLTFDYEIQNDELIADGAALEYIATDSLTLEGGTIGLENDTAAVLTLPEPGAENSLGYNKNISIQQHYLSISAPNFFNFEISDQGGTTTDRTPLLIFEADNEAAKIALSCDNGLNWNNWTDFPSNTNQLNREGSSDFDILSCGTEEGLKTIVAKVSNSFGYESINLSDSTIFESTETTTDSTTTNSDSDSGETTDLSETSTTSTVTISTTLAIPESEDHTINERLIEVGYVDQNEIWKSFTNYVIENSQIKIEAEVENGSELEVRVVNAEILENIDSEEKTTIRKAVLPTINGEIPVSIQLISDDTSEATTVEISAGTKVSSSKNSGNYDRVIYAPQVIKNPPSPSSGNNITVNEAVFVGSSSESISFNQPVLLTLSVEKNTEEPRIYHFDEDLNDWIITNDAKNGESGGELSEDGKTISIWIDHMTLFGVVSVRDITLTGIKRIALGANVENRANFTSGEWFSPADIGNDDLVSFAWSGNGERFYHRLDDNPQATSFSIPANTTNFTTNFYLDKIRIKEGVSYLHLMAEDKNEERGKETVFAVRYDKTSPQLAEVFIDETSEFKVGKEINLKIMFSEEITTLDYLTIYFGSGEILEIPAINSAAKEVEAKLTISKAKSPKDLEIVLIIGMLIDRVGLIAINPQPLTSNLTTGQIRNAKLSIHHPAQLVEGKYFTKRDFVSITPSAEGATKMRLAANVLGIENEWLNYSGKEIRVPLKTFGTQKVVMEFTNAANDKRSTGTVITRLPANSEDLIKMQKQQNKVLEALREKISNKLKELLAWGIAAEYEEMLEESNPAILPSSGEIPSAEETEKLNEIFELAYNVKKLANKADPSIKKIRKLAKQLLVEKITLNDFLTISEINSLLSKVSSSDVKKIIKYLNYNVISLRQSGERISVEKLSAGMRDSDSDGISDLIEIEIGSNPFISDSDGDGKMDGEEWLDFGSNPMKAEANFAAGFTNLANKIADPRPLFNGVAKANAHLQIIAENENGENISLGNTTADASGKWLLISEVVLPAGNYKLKLKNEGVELATQKIEVNLDFILLPPKVHMGKSKTFASSKPAFFGNTFYGSRVVGIFESELTSTAIVADNSFGDFVIRPPRDLEVGKHTLTIFNELPDGTRSPARMIDFEITETQEEVETEILSLLNIISAAGILFVIYLAGLFISRKKHA